MKEIDPIHLRATIEAIVLLQHRSPEAKEVFLSLMERTLDTAEQYARLTVANTDYEALLIHHRDVYIKARS